MFRKLEESDRGELEKEIDIDPWHEGDASLKELFYDPACVSMAVGDNEGEVFYLSIAKEARIRIQFKSGVSKDRIKKALEETNGWLPKFSREKGFKALVFDSVSDRLIWFMWKLGFRSKPDNYWRAL